MTLPLPLRPKRLYARNLPLYKQIVKNLRSFWSGLKPIEFETVKLAIAVPSSAQSANGDSAVGLFPPCPLVQWKWENSLCHHFQRRITDVLTATILNFPLSWRQRKNHGDNHVGCKNCINAPPRLRNHLRSVR
jgi:hypothetical protein